MENPKNLVIGVGIGVVSLIMVILFIMSWKDVKPGEEGFIYRPYSGGIDTSQVYQEGTHFVAFWNDMTTYNVLRESSEYVSEVLDKNGTPVTITVSVSYYVVRGESPRLHLRHGVGYKESFIDPKVKGAIKDVIGRYSYEEVYSTKREALEDEIESILFTDFDGNSIALNFVEVADVDLPNNIIKEITRKEEQKQRNITSELIQIENKNLADAKIETARGDSAKVVIESKAQSMAINEVQRTLMKSKDYIEYIKWLGFYEGKGSPFGTGNVFGTSGNVNVLKSN